jgi:hypothetical protein
MVRSESVIISMTLVLLLLAAGVASAGLGVSGSKLEKNVAPGDKFTHVMQVKTDPSDSPVNISVDIFGITQGDDGAIAELNASKDTSAYTARPFLKVSPTSFHLDPGKTQQVTLEVDIPNDVVGSGGKYALVKIRTLPVGTGMVGFSTGVYVPIRLTFNGAEILNKGEIESINLEKVKDEDKQILFVLLKNTGNHHYYPKLNATVKDKDGKIVANASVPRGIALLPTYSRLFKPLLNSDTPLKPGTYDLNTTISMEDGTVLATKETSIEVKS